MTCQMSRNRGCSIVSMCRGCFVIVLFLLVAAVFDSCLCSQNVSRIFKREVIDGNLQEYLSTFGYIAKSADGAFALRTEESIRGAIKEMQAFAGIPVTGTVDDRTAKLIRTPRCGLPDREIGLTSGRRKRYTIHGLKWPYADLTWSLRTKQFANLDPYEVRYVISKALDVWSKHSKLTFTEVDSDRADILIYFYRKEHGDMFPFDGPGVILAHAFFPTGTRSSVEAHFDADEKWTTGGDNTIGTSLFNVAAHEIGHSLGLSHSNVQGALMYPWYSEMKDGFEYELPDDDKQAIQYLYGVREKQWARIPKYNPQPVPNPRPHPTPTTTTTSTTTTTRPPTARSYPRTPYDPRYPNGRHPIYNKPEKNPYKPMNPEKKPQKHKPKHEHNPHYPHHKHPYTGHHYPPTDPPYTKPPKTTPRKHHTHRPTEIPSTPKEYPNNQLPDSCDTTYDAVAVLRRELFIFKDKYFWRIGDNGQVTSGYPVEINRLFRGFPRNLSYVDAVFERGDGNIMFFVDDKYYLFSGVTLEHGYPKSLTELGLPSSLKKIDGAMIWGHNGKTYFFSGSDYWRFDDEEQKVEMDYPRKMKPMWRGVGTDIDAVFQWKDGKTYFFKGKGFWKFNDQLMRVDHYRQKLSAPVWMGCKQNYEENDLNQKLPYTDISFNSGHKNVHNVVAMVISIATILLCRVFLL